MASIQGEYLLRHYERFLGEVKGAEYVSEGKGGTFQILLFRDQPEPGLNCVVTFGVSAADIALGRQSQRRARVELMICADASIEIARLAGPLMVVARTALEARRLPDLHELMEGEGAVSENPLFEHIYLTNPGYFPAEFDACEGVAPPIEIVQLVPVSNGEREIITRLGWARFEDGAAEQGVDFAQYDRRPEVRAD
jgi:hypothetical protein